MTDIKCHITTFNCGRELVHIDYFASSLYSTLHSRPGRLPPDLIVLALQEIAPIGFAFLGGSLLAPYFLNIGKAVTKATLWAFGQDAGYGHILTRHAGLTGFMVFARKEIKDRIEWMEEAATGVGLWEMGNKGAVGVRLALGHGDNETLLTFVAAHLAPMEDAWEKRNEDWKRICETLVFDPVHTPTKRSSTERGDSSEHQALLSSNDTTTSQHSLFDPPSHVFFAGDLNYRTSDTAPDPKGHQNWPQPDDPAACKTLLARDQLTRELHSHSTLHNLTEASIDFPPTYKYSADAQRVADETARSHAASKDDPLPGLIKFEDLQESAWLWAKHRFPSWCDRVLFLASAKAQTTVFEYTSLPVQPSSDHRPVVLSCSVPKGPVRGAVEAPFDVVKHWRQRRAAARKLELMVGAGAYLGLTGQGQVLLAGTVVGVVGGYVALQYLLGG